MIHQSKIAENNIVGEIRIAKSRNDDLWGRHNLLQSLAFPEMIHRHNTVHQRVGDYGDTYMWIFTTSQETDGERSNVRSRTTGSIFADWLRGPGDDGMFWITGKPGSGKSSLMNHIHTHLRDDELEHLPAPPDRMVLSHYFYRSNNVELQKSFEGFLRTVCCQALAADSNLIDDTRHVLNQSQTQQLDARRLGSASCTPWLVSDLTWLCKKLLQAAATQKVVYLLVDGIDEMIDEQQDAFITFLKKLDTDVPRLRICCSARAEAYLQSILSDCKSLRLHDLNCQDMEKYCNRVLAGTPVVKFINTLVWRAEGVFLWLYIVANDMKRHWKYESNEDLRARLDACPGDISALFSHMLKRLDSYNLKQRPYLAYIHYFSRIGGGILLNTLELLLATQFYPRLQEHVIDRVDPELINVVAEACEFASEQITMYCAGLVESRDWHTWINNESLEFLFQQLEDQMTGNTTRDRIISASTQHWFFIHKTVSDFLDDSFSLHGDVNLVQMPPAESYRHMMKAWAAAIKIRHWLSPSIFSCIPGVDCPQTDATHTLICTCQKVIDELLTMPNGTQIADEILSDVSSVVFHCWHEAFSHMYNPGGLLLRLFGKVVLVSGAALQSQLFCLAALGRDIQYALSKIDQIPIDDRLPIAALMSIWTYDEESKTPGWGNVIDNLTLILSEYDLVDQHVSIAETWGGGIAVGKYCEVSLWHYMIADLWRVALSTTDGLSKPPGLQILQLFLDRGAANEVHLELSLSYNQFTHQFQGSRPEHLHFSNRIEDFWHPNLFCNYRKEICAIDFNCRIPSVETLAKRLFQTGQESDNANDWKDLFQISITRVSPMGVDGFFTPTDYENLAIYDLIIEHICEPVKIRIMPFEQGQMNLVNITRRMLFDRCDEISMTERKAINRFWKIEPFVIDEDTTDNGPAETISGDA